MLPKAGIMPGSAGVPPMVNRIVPQTRAVIAGQDVLRGSEAGNAPVSFGIVAGHVGLAPVRLLSKVRNKGVP